MVNYCIIGGIIASDINLKETSTGKKWIWFELANTRPYKEGGKYKTNFIHCVTYRPTVLDFMLDKMEKGCRITVCGEFKVDMVKDPASGKEFKRCYLSVQEVYPMTYKRFTPDETEIDEDNNVDVAQVDW